jgi:hypothetical protein
VSRPSVPTASELAERVTKLLAQVESAGWPVWLSTQIDDASSLALASLLDGRCPFCGQPMSAPQIGAGLTWDCPEGCRP